MRCLPCSRDIVVSSPVGSEKPGATATLKLEKAYPSPCL